MDVQPPDEADRQDIFRIHTRKTPCNPDVSMKELAQLTEGYTGADIMSICRKAALSTLAVCSIATPPSIQLLAVNSCKICFASIKLPFLDNKWVEDKRFSGYRA